MTVSGDIKRSIKRRLTEGQLEFFRSFKRRLAAFRRRLLEASLALIPLRVRIYIRSHTTLRERMDFDGGEIYLEVDSAIEYRTRLHSCKKETETVDWMRRFFKAGDVVFDVGANVGAYSLVASKLGGGAITVYAFEPGFPTFYKLCRNILTNRSNDSVVPLQVALSDQTRLERFHYSDLAPGAAMHALGERREPAGADGTGAVYAQPVMAYRMDDLIDRFGLPNPAHIKVDVDGGELAVLRGAVRTLSRPTTRSLLMEINEAAERDAAEIAQLLAKSGFKMYAKKLTALCGDKEVCNCIFHKE